MDELSDWATAKITDRMLKSAHWTVAGIEMNRIYQVDDRQKIHIVDLGQRSCTCRKWQVSALPCGHVLAVCRVMGMTDCNHLAKAWFRKIELKATYQDLVYPVGEVSSWQCPSYLQVVKPPLMAKPQSGRPKNKDRIRSQGEEPVPVKCGRCGNVGHTRQSCRETLPKKKVSYVLLFKAHYLGYRLLTHKLIYTIFRQSYLLEEAHSKQCQAHKKNKSTHKLLIWMTHRVAYFSFF